MPIQKAKQKKTRLKPELPAGFRDYDPEEAIQKQKILGVVRKTFESFGFDPIETPAVERTEVLTCGEEESEKIIFNVKGSREKKSDMSLRFDLTVPLARFVAGNPEIPKPFKRYQIGEVYRGESPQKGRYRGFTQADIDIVGSSSMDADAEVIATIYWALKNIGIDEFVIKVSSRKILDTLPDFAGFPKKKLPRVLRILDKSDKIGKEKTRTLLVQVIGGKAATKTEKFIEVKIVEAAQGFKDIIEIIDCANNMGVDEKNFSANLSIDKSIVRGLNYYTGMVFETFLIKAPEIGSIASGGRYDNLLKVFTGQSLPAVGASIGVDRLFVALEKLGKLEKKATTTAVLILNLSSALAKDYFAFANELRNAGINTALYLGDDRAFQAQFAYAVKKEIPYVIIYGENEKKKGVVAIKNLTTREQKEISKEEIIEYFKKIN